MALPLSAGRMTRSIFVLREVRAALSCLDRLDFGKRAEYRILAVSKRMESASCLGRFLMEVSSVVMFLRAVAKLRPFDKSVFSDSEWG